MRFLAFSDPHFSTDPPVGRTETYAERLLHKLDVVREVGAERKVGTYLCSGDFLHRRHHATHRDVQVLVRALGRFDKPVYSVWGNHDATSDEQVGHRAYGCLVEAGVIECLDGGAAKLKGCVVTGWGYRAGIDAVNEREERAPELYVPPRRFKRPVVHLAHGMLMLDDAEHPFECTRVEDVEGQTARVVVCGHYHTPQEPREVGGCWYVCPGGLGRYSRAERDRDICVAVIDVDGGDVAVDQFSIRDRVGVSDDDWLPEDRALVSMADVRGVAEGLTLGSGDLRADADEAVASAAAELGLGPEVVGEARRFLEEARG
jgi:DNA repair exonuclease SbcCD nuclease subunit